MRRMTVAVALLACLWAAFPAVASGPTAPSDATRSGYIVQFRAEPLATASRVSGDKLHPTNPQAVAHRRFLDATQRRVLFGAGVSDAHVGYSYRTTVAGFSALLTAAEAGRIRAQNEVASVIADRVRTVPHHRPTTSSPGKPMHSAAVVRAAAAAGSTGPATVVPTLSGTDLGGQPAEFLGLPEGLWARLGGPDRAGEDIVIGVIDGGIYPEHPSFADEPIGADGSVNYIGPAYGPPPATWRGICQEGEAFPASTCNDKLIGARWFVEGLGAANVAEEDFLSARDVDGHGTGVASIAAGNYGVDPSYQGNDLGLGVISGIAPRARIAHYKALWAVPLADSVQVARSDLVAAIDAAVSDGVDILSVSLGVLASETLPVSDSSTMLDPESLAMLRAFDAGVLPVLPAGNAGPEPEGIDAPGHTPWTLSVGASALSTTFAATATVSGAPDGTVLTVQGISPTPALPPVPLIDGAAAAAPGASPADAAACAEGALDPALVKGKAVLCQPEQFHIGSAILSELGAAGGVFYQGPRSFRDAFDVWLPSVIVSPADAQAIRQLIASTTNPTLALTAGTVTPTATGDVVVGFSSRGPTLGTPSILKPDLVAPGVDVIAAHTPEVPPGARSLFDFSKPDLFRPLGGTSVSVPITAGAAALLLSLDPDRSPSELKSALMTTAQPNILIDAPGTPSVPATVLAMGAGRIDPNRAADPGLVVTETTARFENYVAAQAPTRDPSQPTIEATDLNLPSIAFDPLVGPRSTERTFTGVDDLPGTWTSSIEGLEGITVTVSPPQFSVGPGQSAAVQFAFAPADPGLGEYVDGAVVFTNDRDGRTVRLAVNVRPEVFEAPEQLNFGATQAAGHAPLALPTGFPGQLSALGYGFAPPEVRRDQTVGMDNVDDEDLNRIAQPGPGVAVFDLTVPDGAQAMAAEITGSALVNPLADLDLYVFHDDEGDGFRSDDFVDASTTLSQEAVFLFSPDPGAYRISVRGFVVKGVATFDLTTWVLADPTPDELTDLGPGLRIGGDPEPVTVGGIGTLDLEWAGLDAPGVYLGLVTFHDTAVPNPNDPIGEMPVVITRQ